MKRGGREQRAAGGEAKPSDRATVKRREWAATYGRLAVASARSGAELAARDFAHYAASIGLGHDPGDLLRERVKELRRHVRQAEKAIRDEDARVAVESEQIEKRISDRANEEDDHEAEKPISRIRAARVGKRGPDRDLKRMEFLARLGFAYELLVALLQEAAAAAPAEQTRERERIEDDGSAGTLCRGSACRHPSASPDSARRVGHEGRPMGTRSA